MASRFFGVLNLLSLLFVACVATGPSVSQGLQPGYSGAQFARFLFPPVLFHVNPSHKAFIDKAAVESDRVAETVEKAVKNAFVGQPAVLGLSPTAMKAHFAKAPLILSKPAAVLLETSERLGKSLGDTRELPSQECSSRKNYVDFFVECVSASGAWRDSLVQLSSQAFNADAALFVVVTDLNKSLRAGVYSISASVAVLLVDLNNGRLVWAHEVSDVLGAPASKTSFPDWSLLFSKMFGEAFWIDFPGRTLHK